MGEKKCDNCRHRGQMFPWICYRDTVNHLFLDVKTCGAWEAKDG